MHPGQFALCAAILLLGMPAARAQTGEQTENASCLGCHGSPGFAAPSPTGQMRTLFVSADRFTASVHGKSLRCVDCHTTMTEVPHKTEPKSAAEARRQIPELCAGCHPDALQAYRSSIHGTEAMDKGNGSAAVCSDCHTAHSVMPAQADEARLAISASCGNCHPTSAQSYRETYHGQVLALGYAATATCADCHNGHAIRHAGDPTSTVAPANLLSTCRKCHQDATAGFATFQAHATTDDFPRYPYTWLASKFVALLIVVTFGVFWTHSALWFYREYRDRQQRKLMPHVRSQALPKPEGPYYQRWNALWRWAHLIFAVAVIVLVMTGIPLLYPDTSWAPLMIRALGGPAIAGLVHRVSATIMLAVFVAHLVYAAVHIARNWRTFKWFGPYSLLPNLQDARDFAAMLKWFFGRAPRPMFDHWNYQQKVDYWAPFWGIAMLAATGAMLWFKTLTGTYLPGWAFNFATVIHGDEAVLAGVYLFTIHYFCNHWRPDKFPLDLVMFTGSMPLDEFRREYAVEYDRLVERNQLEKYLVAAPSRPMTLGSTILGLGLIIIGLVLLVMMLIGFYKLKIA